MYSAKVLADSVSEPGNVRLTTLEVTFPRMVLSEFNTHRVFSRNSASSRAIPIEKKIKKFLYNPFIPAAFGKNQKGMQSGDALNDEQQQSARDAWILGMHRAVDTAEMLSDSEVHKQWANRVLEPYMWHTAIVTSTYWDNFFKLRISYEAQPEIRTIAKMMQRAMHNSRPKQVKYGEWHLPLFSSRDMDEIKDKIDDYDLGHQRDLNHVARLVSAGRCARVSYLTHDGKRDLSQDIVLAQRLVKNGHMSPFEHVATPAYYPNENTDCNFKGWRQFRNHFERGDHVIPGLDQ